jgi:GDP-4-dehydro-6-deoxy-D-mannose reductase
MYQTELALSYFRKGSDVVIGRVFNIIGWATPVNFSIGKFAHEISLIQRGSKKHVLETKGLDSERDYVDIQDVCSALMAIAENGKSGDIYNICSGRSYKIKYLLDYLLKLSDLEKVKVKTINSRDFEIKSIRGSNRKITKDTNWKPKVNIFESLENTLDYYRRAI